MKVCKAVVSIDPRIGCGQTNTVCREGSRWSFDHLYVRIASHPHLDYNGTKAGIKRMSWWVGNDPR